MYNLSELDEQELFYAACDIAASEYDIPFESRPMSDTWKSGLIENGREWWMSGYEIPSDVDPNIRMLKERLLSFGG